MSKFQKEEGFDGLHTFHGWQVGQVVEVETAEAPALIFDWQVWQHTKKGRLKEIIVVDEAWRYTKTMTCALFPPISVFVGLIM